MRAMHVSIDDGRLHATRTVALHPAVFGEHKPGKLLAERLDHVIALKFAMHRHVESNFFLPANALGNLLLEKSLVVDGWKLALLEAGAGGAHLFCLRKRTDGRRWK